MALTAKLKLGMKEFNLLKCEYEFNQPIDKNGKPCANPKGGIIDFTIHTQKEVDIVFHEWMLSKIEEKGGEIEFDIPVKAKSTSMKLVFNHAHCIYLNGKFDSQSPTQMLTRVKISAAVIYFGSNGPFFTNNELLAAFGL